MSANSKRSENEETAGASNDFESGLDYGAYAEDDPDFPEDHMKAEETSADETSEATPQDRDSAAQTAATDPTDEGATRAVPRPSQDETRPLDDVAPVGTAASGDRPAERPDDTAETTPVAAGTTPVAAGTTGAATPAGTEETARPGADEATGATTSDTTALPRTTDTGTAAAAGSPETISAESQAPAAVPEPAPAAAAAPVGSAAPASTAGKEEQPYRPYEPAPAAGTTSRTESGEAITDADLDEEVSRDKRGASRFLQVLIAIFVPLMVTVAAIRLVASPAFLWIAYNRPGFPEDGLGFDIADRLLYGSYGMDYLSNAANSRYLSELAPGGEQLFTEAEVSHMTDVKIVMLSAMGGGLLLLLITLIFALLLRRWRPGGVARGFFAGAWVTLGLIIAAVVVAILAWQEFFDAFHRVFFTEGTWTFSPESALIRLYPEQFWMDAGIAVGGLVLIIAILTLIITWPTKRRRARRQARLEEVYAIRREKLVTELTKDAEYSNAPKARR